MHHQPLLQCNFPPLRDSKIAAKFSVKSVVIPQLSNKQSVVRDFVNHSVFFVDSPRPVTREVMFKGFWLADSFKWLSLDFFD
jgi:hypothetical protein